MTLTAFALLGLVSQGPATPAGHVPLTPTQQIAAAVQAAPEERRAEASVMGYDGAGKLVMLRQGKGDLVCLADNPKDADFEVDCYQKDLEPFMARGRELSAQGMKGKERNETRWKEIEDGKVAMPKTPSTLYILEGKGFDPVSGEIAKPYRRYVVYTPYATPESTGLSTMPIPGGPWLMFPGKPSAHIMINPPEPEEKK